MKNLKKLLSMILVLALLMADFGLAQEMMVADSGDLSAIEELLADTGLELTGETIEEDGEVKFAVEAIDAEEEPIAEEPAMDLLPIEEIEDVPAEEEAPAENPETSAPEAADSEATEAEPEAPETAAPETEAAAEETMGEIVVDQMLAPPAECPYCGAVGQSHVAYNDDFHWWVCDNCYGCITEDEAHYSACTDGNDTEECDVCHAWGNEGDGAYIYVTHEVAEDAPYSSNAQDHWKVCTLCGGKAELGSHYISCDNPDAAQCEVCGYAAAHFEIAHADIDFDSYVATAEGHGYRCNICGEIVGVEKHEIDCYESTTHCAYCGYEVDPDDPNVEVCHTIGDTYTWDADAHYASCAYCGAEVSGEHWASCTDDACWTCGASVEEINVDFEHSNLTMKYSDDAHWNVCLDCGEELEAYEHWAYCHDTHTCAECGRYSKTAYSNIVDEFDWDNFVEITSTHHVVECMNCGEQQEYRHYKWCADTDSNTCADCGASGVKLQLAHGEYESQITDQYHASYCVDCGKIGYIGYVEPHYGSCANPLKCAVCGYAMSASGDSLSHNYVITKKGSTGHTYTCSDCGETVEEIHWANCDKPNVCAQCGYTGKNLWIGGHTYGDCTWDADRHYADCIDCGEKDIFADYSEHRTYCFDADACRICEAPADEINLIIEHQYVNGVCVYCGAERTGIANILMPATIELGLGEKLNLDLRIDPADAEGSVDYAFSKTGYVTLNPDTLLLTAKKRGTVQLTATADNGVSAVASVIVKKAPSKVTLSSKAVTLGAGDSYTLSATLAADSASQLSWSSSNANVASVDETGRITAVEAGKATITVKTFNGKKASCTVTVVAAPDSVAIDHVDVASVGQTVALKTVLMSGKTALASDNYTLSCEPAGSVEFIDDTIKLLQEGEVTLIATAYNGCEGRSTLNVQPAPDQLILNAEGEIEKEIILGVGEKMVFTPAAANGSKVDVEPDNEDPTIASVSGNEEKFTIAGKKVGETTITLQPHLGEAAILHVTVMKAPSKLTMSSKKLTLGAGETAQLSVSFPSGSHSNLTWKSSKAGVVAVDADGNLKAIAAGSSTITATAFNKKKASCTVTVKKAPTGLSLTCNVEDGVLSVGQTADLKVALSSGSAGSYTYSVDPASVGAVSFDGNKLIAEASGEVTVIATAYNGVSDALTLNIQPAPDQAVLGADAEITLGVGEKFTLKPEILNGSKADFSYTAENSKIATVSAAGLITAKKAGQTTITVQPHLGAAAVLTVNVVAAPKSVTLSSKKLTMGVGETAQLIATLNNTGAASALTWKSSKPAIVAVDADGNLKAIKAGSSTITVTTFNGKKASCTVTVKAAPTALDLSINADVISLGQTAKLTAALSPAKCADGVDYILSADGVVSISGSTVTPIQPGEVTITAATYNGLSDSVPLQVLEAPDQLVIAETDIELGVGEKYELKPVAANGSPVTISYKAKSSKVATVNASGLITGKKAGKTTITLTPHAGEGVVVNVSVLAAPKKLSLSASELKLNIGDEVVLEAVLPSKTASKITWASNNEEAVKVDAQGKLIAVGEGVATITAKTFNGKTAKCTVSVEGLPQAQNFSAAYVGEGIANFSWEAVENADGYQLLAYLDGEWKVLEETEGLSAQISGLADGQYQMAVRAYLNRDGKMVYGKNAIANLIVADALKILSLDASAIRLQPGKAAAWTVELEGGLQPYAYAFDLYKDGALLKAGEAGASNRFECVLEEEGVYTVIVRVTDGVGNEVSAESDALNVIELPYYFETKEIDDNRVEIIGLQISNSFDGNLTVPAVLDGKTVAGVGAEAFSGCTALESVELPDSVNNLGYRAFADCDNLERVTLGSGVVEIGSEAFANCHSLKAINLNAVKFIGDYGFNCCCSLKEIQIDSLEDMGRGAFGNCSSLRSVHIPGSLTRVSEASFESCYSLLEVRMDEGVQFIEENAFFGCGSLRELQLPTSLKRIGSWAFIDTGNLGEVDFTALDVEFGEDVFSDSGITMIVNKDSVAHDYARENGLNYIVVGEASEDGLMYELVWEGDEAIGAAVVGYDCGKTGSELEGTLVIPASAEIDGVEYPVIEVGNYAIAEFGNLHEVVLPDTIRTLCKEAFYSNWNLRKINLPEGLESIAANAFEGCEKLEEITIPESCNFVGSYAFASCSQLKKLTILSKNADFDDGHLLDESPLAVVYCYTGSTAETLCKGEWGNGDYESIAYTLIDGDVEYYGVRDISLYKYAGCVNETAIWAAYAVGYEGKREFRYDLYRNDELYFSSDWTAETRFEYTFAEDGDYQLGVSMRINGDEATATEAFMDDEILSIFTFSDTTPFTYMIEGNGEGVRICGYNDEMPEYLEIPETLEVEVDGEMRTLPVVTIGAGAFMDYNERLRGVTIPNSVQRIMCYAFANTYLENVEIPDSVTTLEYGAFELCLELESVDIGSGVTEIPYGCFRDCSSLTSVRLPAGLKAIDDSAFQWCYELAEIQLPEGLERVGANAFEETDLNEITIPDSVVEIGDGAFMMTPLRSVQLGSGLRSIGGDAFSGSNVSSINLEDTALETLGSYAFARCEYLNSVRLPDTLTEMGMAAFYGCCGLESVVMGDGLTELPQTCFEECSNLRSVTLPANLESIGAWCFKYCVSLNDLALPDSLTAIGDFAFEGCNGFVDGFIIPENVVEFGENVFCDNGSELYVVRDSAAHDYVREWDYEYVVIGEASGDLLHYDVIDDCIEIAYYEDTIEGELVIPAEIDGMPVVSIADDAFEGQDRMTSVSLPDSLERIGNSAFRNCRRLTRVILPEGLESIGEEAFACCDRLEKLQIPASVNEIGDRLIEDSHRCVLYVQAGSAAEEYAIANDLPYDNGASASFRVLEVQVTKWTDVVYDFAAWRAFVSGAEEGMEYNYRLYKDGDLFRDFGWSTESTVSFDFTVGGDYTMELAVRKANGETSDYVMGTETVIIGEEWDCFRYNYVGENEIKITSVTECEGDFVIPESLWSSTVKVVGIADYCFGGREGLTGVTLPSTLRSIGDWVFDDCVNLAYVDFGENSQLESIGSYAFANCDSLTEISLPDGVTRIGEGMFDHCDSLESVRFADGISELPDYIFRECGNLQNVDLPANLKRINSGAFIYSGIEAITLPNGVETIETSAFEASALRSIHIPDGVARLEYRSFADCGNLESVSLGSGVIEIESEAFIYCHNLREINLSGVKFIGDYAFHCCGLEEIQIDSMEDMGRCAFADCGNLRSVHIPGSLTWVSESSFENCGSLSEVIMDEGVQYIEDNAFSGCGSLYELQLPSSLKRIGDWAFNDTYSLGELDFTALDVEFGEGAFNNSGITMLVNMDSPAYFYAQDNNLNYRLADGSEADASALRFEIQGEAGEEYAVLTYYDGEPVGDLVIPETYEENGVTYPVVGLGDGCLNNGANIMNVTIPASVEFIGNEAFVNCWRMRSVQLETSKNARAAGCSLTSIGNDAFANCTSLNSINLGDAENLQSIGDRAFESCTSLQSVSIPAGVETIGENALASNPYVILNVAPGSAGEQYAKDAGLAYNNGSGIALTVQEVAVEQYAEVTGENASWRTHWVGGEGDVSFSYYLYRGGEIYETLAENTTEEWIEYTFRENGIYHLEAIATDAAGNQSGKMSSNCVTIREYDEISGFSYSIESIEDRTLWIIGCSEEMGGDVVVPAELTIGDTVYAVTTVSSFGQNGNITSLTLSEGIRRLDYECFGEMENLVEVSLPTSLEGIADRAFVNCRQLQSIQIRSAEYIGREAFCDCASLERIVSGLPSNLQEISDIAFAGCNALCMEGSSLPDRLSYVGSYAFADCYNLGTLNISENLCDLGEDVFCNSNVTICANVGAYILQYAMEHGYEFIAVGAADLEGLRYKVMDGGAIIDGYDGILFGDLAIPAEVGDGLPVIGIDSGAFVGQSGIMHLSIPTSVETIGEEAFAGCTRMRVNFEGEGLKTIAREAFAGCRDIGNVDLPNSVESIGYRAFSDCEYLCEIKIGANVTNMGADIFQNSPRVSLLVEAGSTAHTYAIAHDLPYNTGSGYVLAVQYVQIHEWDGCEDREAQAEVMAMGGTEDYLYQYQLYRNGEAYGAESAWTADNWYTIEFTESGRYQLFARVKDSNGAISQYKASETMDICEFDAETGLYYAAISNTEAAVLGMQDASGEVAIPETLGGKAVVEIANRAFEGCEQLEGVILPEGLREIDNHAFQDCFNLRSVNFPASLERIGNAAFRRTAIENASLPDGLETIDESAFNGNGALESIAIPSSVKALGDYAFSNCGALTDVQLSEGLESIGVGCFTNAFSLQLLAIPASVNSIGVDFGNVHAFVCAHENFKLAVAAGSYAQEYAERFNILYLLDSNVSGEFTYGYNADYTGVVIQKYSGSEASVIVPESLNDMPVVAIGEGAFENNSSLTAIDLPDTVEVIGTRAFANCEKLSNMT